MLLMRLMLLMRWTVGTMDTRCHEHACRKEIPMSIASSLAGLLRDSPLTRQPADADGCDASPAAGAAAGAPSAAVDGADTQAAASTGAAEAGSSEQSSSDLIASIVAETESWFTPWFGSWKSSMGSGTVVEDGPDSSMFVSDRFQWLPADVFVGTDGRVVFDSYINNLHPDRHAQLYAATAQLLQRMLPLFERTLATSTQRPQRVVEVPDNTEWWWPQDRDHLWELMKESGEAEKVMRRWRAGLSVEASPEAEGAPAPPSDDVPKATDASAPPAGTVNAGGPTEDTAAAGPADCDDGGQGDKCAEEEIPSDIPRELWREMEEVYQRRKRLIGATLPEAFVPPPPPPTLSLRRRLLRV